MPKAAILVLLFIALFPVLVFGETDSLPAKYLSLGSKKAGICFGNSPVYTGFRFNLINNNVKRLNIFDLSLYNSGMDNEESNGVSIAVAANAQHQNNGLSVGGFVNAMGIENGIMMGLFYNGARKINGIGIGCLFASDTLNGLIIAPMMSGKWFTDSLDSRVNGVTLAIVATKADVIKGVAISAQNISNEHKGLAVGVFNSTKRLKGIQIGLYNIALNNPRGLRRLPLINAHLGK